MVQFDQRLRLCDANKKKLPIIKDLLRKKVQTPWFSLTEKELKRIRQPFDSYDKELLESGYPQSCEHLRRLLAVKSDKKGEIGRNTTLVGNKALLKRTIDCLTHLEVCERNGNSLTEAIDALTVLAENISATSDRVAHALYEIILHKIDTCPCEDISKIKLRCSFGKYLVKLQEFQAANDVLKEAWIQSEENNFHEIFTKISKVYYESLYNLCLKLKTTDQSFALQLADDSKVVALKMNDVKAITMSNIQRGNIHMEIKNYNKAIIDFEEASKELKKLPNIDLKLEVLYKLSTCYFITQDYQSCLLSLGALGRLAAVYKKVSYQAHFGRIDGNVKLLMGENIIARKSFINSIEIYDKIGLREFATSCRFLEAIAKCEFLIDPLIILLLDGEKKSSFEERYVFNKSKILVFNWKLQRENFYKSMDE